MKLTDNVEAIDLALCVDSCLIIADVHIGYEEALNKRGILVPRFQFPEIIKRLDNIFKSLKNKKKKIKKIIINGDLKHEFGTISSQEWRNVLKLLDFLKKHCDEIIITKGNHDPILKPIAEKKGIKIFEHYRIKIQNKNILIMHGDKIPEEIKKYDTVIIGHEHPAISLKHGPRVELYKCYLVGKYKGKNIIVQPSLNLVTEGADIMKEKLLSPFLQQGIDNFHVFAVEDKIYKLGKVKDIRKIR